MAGPVYRLEKCAERVCGGDLAFEVRLRDHDEFQELASIMDKMLKKLNNNIYNIGEIFNDVAAVKNKLSEKVKTNNTEDIAREVSELSLLLDHMDEYISVFKTKG